ncbi:MAG: hypothetical protein ACXWXA_08650 [Candidatus Limnocylindrales bacterium]
MKPIAFCLQFRGTATAVAPGVLVTRATAPGCALVTSIDETGVHGHFEPSPGAEAVLETRILLADAGALEIVGTISLGHGHLLRVRSVDGCRIGPSPDRHLKQGSAIYEIEPAPSRFDVAQGRIASNFLLSDTGEFTDNQLGLVFVESPATRTGTRGWDRPAGRTPQD